MTVAVSGDSITFPDNSVQATAPKVGMVNRVINGGMTIDQRNAGASVTGTNGLCLDRWTMRSSQASKYTVQQSTNGPTGFSNSLLVTSSSAYSVVASDYFTIDQRVETANVIDLAWGTSAGATVTLSFWVRSSLTGTFTGVINEYNSGSATYGFAYTINAANTWEQKSVTIPSPTIGTWNTTMNGGYLTATFSLGVGADEATASNNSWLAVNRRGGTGGTSVVGTSGATFYITGVQLEKGSTATSFDYRPYGTELGLCQRYFEKSYEITVAPATATDNGRLINICGTTAGSGSSVYAASINFCVEKRAAPTMVYYDSLGASGKITTFNSVAAPSQGITPSYGFGETSTRGTRMATAGAIAGIGCHWTSSSEL